MSAARFTSFVAVVLSISGAAFGGDAITAPPSPHADAFTVVSGPLSPSVAYALAKAASGLDITIEVAAAGSNSPAPLVDLGVAAQRSLVLHSDSARQQRTDAGVRFVWHVPGNQLVDRDSDWDRLRIAFAVRWPGGPGGADVQRERFRCGDRSAPHDGLPADPANWLPLSLVEYDAQVAERRDRIAFDINQPLDGKYTAVIEDARGNRVRNLVSGQAATRGLLHVEWDGLDDQGRVVPPGDYHWRAASHPGITPHYLFSFYSNGRPSWRDGTPGSMWLSDHFDAVAAASAGDRIYIGAALAESGHAIMQLDEQGVKTAGVTLPAIIGWGTIFLSADEKYFYALSEGHSGYAAGMKDLPGGRWECTCPLSLLRWDLQGNLAPYKGATCVEAVLAENPTQGSGPKRDVPLPDNLAGAAMVDGKLFVSLRKENRILVVDPQSGKFLSDIKTPGPGLLAADRDTLLVLESSGGALARIDPATHLVTPLFKPKLGAPDPFPPGTDDRSAEKSARMATGLAVNRAGEIFISDNGIDQNVKVFSPEGKLLREIGRRGGRPLAGPWDTAGMYQPHGIAIDSSGQLWVTETDPSPRRLSVWDAAGGAFKREFLGPARYGGPGAGFDPQDASRWIAAGALWKVDLTGFSATPVSTLYHRTRPGQIDGELPAYEYQFHHRDGRTFVIGQGCYQSVYELLPDGKLKLWAVCGTPHDLANVKRWTLPAALIAAPGLQSLAAAKIEVTGQFHDRIELPEDALRGLGLVLWVDRNGDGVVQPDEVQVSGPGASIVGGWGADNATLDLRFLERPSDKGAQMNVLTLSPAGFLASGAPDYRLADALAAAKPIAAPAGTSGPFLVNIQATAQDHFGRLLVNAEPIRAFDASGRLLWSFPNQWAGVQGSHDAPLPATGVMQGTLWFLGSAPLDNSGDVTVINGNHGRFFVMTTDGLYLDEMFKDVRVTQQADAYLIGGECFGGCFGRNQADGNYYLHAGHAAYRLFRIDGLKDVRRSDGPLAVSAQQVAAAQRKLERAVAAAQGARSVVVPEAASEVRLDVDPAKWPGDWPVVWGSASRPFPYARVKIFRQGDLLMLAYQVKDPSPFVNNGSDWTLLFKTGDSVNFEFSTDPGARVDRTMPVPGDRRLLIAPFNGKPLAVLYSHREPGAVHPVPFSSPWRTETVDRVTKLESARIKVRTEQGGYLLTAAIPLADLGLPVRQSAILKGDFGVIYGDDAGSIDLLRSYWSNQATGLVNDVPGEIMLNPKLWGALRFEEGK
jgi:hypothetical protein